MDLGIQGNSAVVAASSSGLGKASAAALAEEGVNVVINGRDVDRLEATAEELRETATGEIIAQAGDLTEPGTCDELIERAIEAFGGLDHLVTNAGGPPSGPFLDTSDADWRDAYELLVMSAVKLCRAAAEPLRADGGGTIVAITSRSVKEAIDDLVLSNAVRMGVVGLEKTLSREFAPEVRANVIMPGPHSTDRMQYLIQRSVEAGDIDSYDEGYDQWVEGIPLERMGEPERFGQIVAFLSSKPAAFINGAPVLVDGGATRSNV